MWSLRFLCLRLIDDKTAGQAGLAYREAIKAMPIGRTISFWN